MKQSLEECRGANRQVLRENCTGHINQGLPNLRVNLPAQKMSLVVMLLGEKSTTQSGTSKALLSVWY